MSKYKHQLIAELENKLCENQKLNYHEIMFKILGSEDKKTKVLMHACCAVCASLALEILGDLVDLTIIFYNPNIHPLLEYQRREIAINNLVMDFNKKNNTNIKYIAGPYNPQDFYQKTKEMKFIPEGMQRCSVCYELRFDFVAHYGYVNNFDYFASAITISPKKNSHTINEVGFKSAEKYKIRYLPTDFKKEQGNLRAKEICTAFDVYRQNYCGCIYAAKDQGIDLKNVVKDAKQYVNKNQRSNK